jgi:hypothetical protein
MPDYTKNRRRIIYRFIMSCYGCIYFKVLKDGFYCKKTDIAGNILKELDKKVKRTAGCIFKE